jgi:hypothetical protein
MRTMFTKFLNLWNGYTADEYRYANNVLSAMVQNVPTTSEQRRIAVKVIDGGPLRFLRRRPAFNGGAS